MKTSWSIGLIAVLAFISFNCHTSKRPVVLIETELGNITIEIYTKRAPITAANFLMYVDQNKYSNGSFYRTVTLQNQPVNPIKIEVIQGGLYTDELMLDPIIHEPTVKTGIRHLDGTISMARNEPGTATSEFFICVGDQPELDYGGRRNPDGHGFATFGKVIDGMETVLVIQHQPADGQMLSPTIGIRNIYRIN